MTEELNGKVALVTGAAAKRGMGRAVALRLASEGADVAVLDKFAAPRSLFPGDEGWRGLEELSEEIQGLGRKAVGLTADISNGDEVRGAIETVVSKLGRLDVLVNCAAIRGSTNVPISEGDEEEWKKTFEINLLGAFLISKAAVRHMIERGGGGKIIHFASLAGRMGVKGSAAYAASKWGVIGLVESLALEVAPHGINVNAVCPGMIITNLRDAHFAEQARLRGCTPEEARQQEYGEVSKMIPLGRMGRADDLADVVSFLASSKSDYMTGQALNVCGGVRMD
ncbi:MAG: SDR family oxidoreductase [Deltaproteobacteria bacterium]|nr:SDR family oxidoreductase [Deltaproteobacteria bacterium]